MTPSPTAPSEMPYGDRMVVAFAHWVIRWRWLVLGLSILSMLALAAGAQNLGFKNNYRIFFSQENPQLLAFEEIQNVYTKEDNILFVLRPRTGSIFEARHLEAMRDLTEEVWKIPYATRVDSLTNFQHTFAEADDLTVEDLVPRTGPVQPEMVERARAVALSEPLLVDRLVAPDGRTAAINVILTLPEKSQEEVPEAMAVARAMLADYLAANPDVDTAITGGTPLNNAFLEASQADLTFLVPLMYGALLVVMIALLRSFSGTLATVLVIGFSAASAMGMAGWLGIMLSPPSVSAPTIILTIAIADSIHILVTMMSRMRAGASQREALVESLRVNAQPVFLTSFTTIIGFLSLNFSDAPPFRDLGNITAMGVAAAWVFSMTLLPAIMAILPMRARAGGRSSAHGAMDRLADFVIAKRRVVLWSTAGLVLLLGALIPRIELNDQFVNYFDHSIEFRTDTDFAMQHLSGIYQFQFSIPAESSGGISEPAYLQALDAYAEWLRQQDGVVHVFTLTDIFKRLNKNMHADDPSMYRLPDDRDLAAQYLLLYEMSLPFGLDLNNQIDVDKSATRLVATLENLTTAEGRALEARAEAWIDENIPWAAGTKATSPFVMFSFISKRNIEAMLIGTALAFALISLTLVVALRSVRLGAVSLVPNMVPPIMGFGVWAVLVGEIGLASSVVVATSLGIIVDATVHFLSKYRRARVVDGADTEAAVRYAFSTVGIALWVTSVILIVGFAVLSLSAFEINKSMGMLTAITLACALIADFLLLPALLLTLDRRRAAAIPVTSQQENTDAIASRLPAQ